MIIKSRQVSNCSFKLARKCIFRPGHNNVFWVKLFNLTDHELIFRLGPKLIFGPSLKIFFRDSVTNEGDTITNFLAMSKNAYLGQAPYLILGKAQYQVNDAGLDKRCFKKILCRMFDGLIFQNNVLNIL